MFLEFKYRTQSKLIEFSEDEIDNAGVFIKKDSLFKFLVCIHLTYSVNNVY